MGTLSMGDDGLNESEWDKVLTQVPSDNEYKPSQFDSVIAKYRTSVTQLSENVPKDKKLRVQQTINKLDAQVKNAKLPTELKKTIRTLAEVTKELSEGNNDISANNTRNIFMQLEGVLDELIEKGSVKQIAETVWQNPEPHIV
jgi:molecular chaperone DnaK (HSP70)